MRGKSIKAVNAPLFPPLMQGLFMLCEQLADTRELFCSAVIAIPRSSRELFSLYFVILGSLTLPIVTSAEFSNSDLPIVFLPHVLVDLIV